MEFKQEYETGMLKQIGNVDTTLTIGEVASKCRLIKTESGIKVDCNYTGPNASKYIQYVDKHREEVTRYLMDPDGAPLYEWMEESHQTLVTLKKHEKEKLILYVNYNPELMLVETGIADDNVTLKMGVPLMRVIIKDLPRNEFKLRVFNMLLLADEIALAMGNEELRKMANIEMVKTYLAEIYDKFTAQDQQDYI